LQGVVALQLKEAVTILDKANIQLASFINSMEISSLITK
jgi:hypothetical protein